MTIVDHYEILGVAPSASDAVVRVAYRQRLKEVHPDTGNSDPAEFEAVLAAGAVLLDPSDRDRYDTQRGLPGTAEPRRRGGSVRLLVGAAVVGLGALLLMFLSPWSTAVNMADEVRGASLLPPSLLAGDGVEADSDSDVGNATDPTAAEATEPQVQRDEADEAPEPAQIVALDDEDATDVAAEDAADDPVDAEQPDADADAEQAATEDVADDSVESEDTDAEDPDTEAEAEQAAAEDVADGSVEADESAADNDESAADADAVLPDLADLPERGAIYRAPTLFLVGPVPSQEIADAFYAKAVAVVGEENVVNEYVVHPDAPTDVDGNVRVEQAITFATASATIRPEFVPVLGLALQVLTQNPQASLVIEGHTDGIGEAATNQILSEDRANAVVSWLVAQGVDAGRLSATGYGEERPIADNLTEAGRTVNRRIEFQITDLLS